MSSKVFANYSIGKESHPLKMFMMQSADSYATSNSSPPSVVSESDYSTSDYSITDSTVSVDSSQVVYFDKSYDVFTEKSLATTLVSSVSVLVIRLTLPQEG
jgi:hypothetical protein